MYEEDHAERFLQDIFSLPKSFSSRSTLPYLTHKFGKISSSKCQMFKRKTQHLQPPSTKKNSKTILRVKKLHGWVLIRWVRTWREDGHQVRLVRLVSWDGRLANLQSRGTSRNLRQILKIGAVNLWVFKSCFGWRTFFMFQWWWCVCVYIYI